MESSLTGDSMITAIATQGRYGSSDWLTSYLLMFSDTGHNWKQYRQEDSLGSFPGNSNADSVVQHQLQQPVIARFLRLVPLDWNPSGRIGLRLETYGCPYTSDVMSFDGSSSALVYRPNPGSRETSRDVLTLKFKTLTNSGMVLQVEEQEGHVLSLELDKGKLLLVFRKGRTLSSQAKHLISLGGLLDDQLWHYVKVERHSSHLNLTVDKLTERVQIPADVQINNYQIDDPTSQRLAISTKNFHGCLENLLYNNLNLIELAKKKDHRPSIINIRTRGP
uniref:Contactin associated protein like 3 n=1 Tax=Oryzias sinensis TaxID=183150 RepID=A0A8C7WMR1_9TELE